MTTKRIPQHKQMAMGSKPKPATFKKGGKVHSDVAEDKKTIKSMVKPSALMKKGGKVGKKK